MSAEKKLERIGPLECLTYTAGAGDLNVVFLHGFGADMHDLFPLVQALSVSGVGKWYFPNGLTSAQGVPGGRARRAARLSSSPPQLGP